MRWAVLLVALLVPPLLNVTGHPEAMPAMCQTLLFVMLAVGLNLIVGLAGLLHLGYGAFFAVGAFLMGHLTSAQSPLGLAWNFWPGLVAATALTGLLGGLISWPTLRLRGDYLAIVTMGFGLMLDPVMKYFGTSLKTETGLQGIAAPFHNNEVLWYYFFFACLLGVVLLAWRVRNARLGRSLRAQRDNELAAAACGVDLGTARLQALVLGALIAGLVGALHASKISTLNWAFPMNFNGSIMILAMVILGGIGSLRGAIAGGVVLSMVNLVITPAAIDWYSHNVKPNVSAEMANLLDPSKAQFLLFGLTLVLMMLWRPQGLLPEQPTVHQVSE